jgi:hypothetical protein
VKNQKAPVIEKSVVEKSVKQTPDKATRPAISPDASKQGCTPSFLTNKRGETDELCGVEPAKRPKEYVQPDEEKEAGGES